MADRESLVNEFQLVTLIDRLVPRPAGEIRFPIRRPDDHLVLDLLFDNLQSTRASSHLNSRARIPVAAASSSSSSHLRVSASGPFRRSPPISMRMRPDSERPLDKQGQGSAAKQRPKPLSPSRGWVPRSPHERAEPARIRRCPADVAGIPFTLEAVLDAMRLAAASGHERAAGSAIVTGRLERTFEVVHDAITVNLNPAACAATSVSLSRTAPAGSRKWQPGDCTNHVETKCRA